MDENEKMHLLLETCGKHPEIYNKVSNILSEKFEIIGATVTLLCSYCAIEIMEGKQE